MWLLLVSYTTHPPALPSFSFNLPLPPPPSPCLRGLEPIKFLRTEPLYVLSQETWTAPLGGPSGVQVRELDHLGGGQKQSNALDGWS